MYAIIFIGGRQYKVVEGQNVLVNRLDAKEKEEVVVDKVLFVKKDSEVIIGKPYIVNAKVVCEVIRHTKGPKLIIFKKRAKKHYKKKIGHRQPLTELKIKSIMID